MVPEVRAPAVDTRASIADALADSIQQSVSIEESTMTEVSTVTIITAKPGTAAAVEKVLGNLSDATRTAAGYPRYSTQRGLEDPNVFITIERWDSEETVWSHLAYPALGDVLESTEHLLAAPPRVIYLRNCDPSVPADGGADAATSSPTGERVHAATA
jgi:quinol monooxygenase YgiN